LGERMVPFRTAVLLALVALSALTFTVASAITEYSFLKPYVANLAFSESRLKVDTVTLNFDVQQFIYTSAQVVVRNIGSETATGTVYMYFYDSGGATIATGQNSVTVSAGSTATITVTLGWTTGKNATHLASGKVIIKE